MTGSLLLEKYRSGKVGWFARHKAPRPARIRCMWHVDTHGKHRMASKASFIRVSILSIVNCITYQWTVV